MRRSLLAAGIGTALEGFDVVIFAFLALMISKSFFPVSPTNALLLAFATYGVSFLMRPVGAVVIGIYGDTHGRKAALSLTMVLMGLGSLIIALMPTYGSIGILAPIGILTARLLQGFAAGAEQGSASVFAAEQDGRRRAEFIGWMLAFFGLTLILASGASSLLSFAYSPEDLESWAWRIPFLAGALICPVGWYIRRKTDETAVYREVEEEAAMLPSRAIFRLYSWRMLVSVLLYAPGVAITYLNIYLPSYAMESLGMNPRASYAAGLFSGITLIVAAPLMGMLSDRHFGRYPMFMAATLGIGGSVWPLFVWLANGPGWGRLAIMQFALTACSAAHTVITSTIIVEGFPVQARVTAACVTSAIAFMVFGGFAPLIYAALTAWTGNLAAPSFYVIFAAIISLPSIFWFRSRNLVDPAR